MKNTTKYIEHCGEWHDEDCEFVATDRGVCNCDLKKNKKKREKEFQKIESPKCVQCGREITLFYSKYEIPYCDDPSCPLFGVLQTGILPPSVLGL